MCAEARDNSTEASVIAQLDSPWRSQAVHDRWSGKAQPGPDTKPPADPHQGLKRLGEGVVGAAVIFGSIKFKPLAALMKAGEEASEGEGAFARLTELVTRRPGVSAESLVGDITAKLNQGCLTPEVFERLVASVKPADKSLASAIARVSLPNASDFTLMHNLADMGKQLEAKGVNLHELEELTSAHPASPGQTTAYLFRKANGLKLGIHNLGAWEAPSSGSAASKQPVLLFDHIADLAPQQVGQVRKLLENGRQVFLMDANNFQKGINFTDVAKGTTEEKLASLVEEAKRTRQALAEAPRAVPSHTPSDEELAHHVLNAQTDEDARAVGATVIRPTATTESQLFGQLANRDKVEAFFARYQNPAQRRMALETVADAHYDSFAGIARQTTELHKLVTADAAAAGLDPARHVNYLVGVDNWPNLGASSGGFISSVFRQMNNIPEGHFVDLTRLRQWDDIRGMSALAVEHDRQIATQGFVEPKQMIENALAKVSAKPGRTYVLDDLSHSGEQIEEVYRDLRREHGVGSLSFATLHTLDTSRALKYVPTAEREAAGRPLRFLTLDTQEPVEGATKRTIKALTAAKRFFSAPSDELVQARARYQVFQEMTADAPEKKLRVANQLNPYVLSDRTNPITSAFARDILRLHQWGLAQAENVLPSLGK